MADLSYQYHPNASGLSDMEKFMFSLVRSASCHFVSMPLHRYSTILMTKNTLLERDDDMISNRLLLFDENSWMAMYYRMCLLLTSHGTSLVFKERVKRKINVQRTDNRAVRVIKRCLFSTITRVITFSFGYYFNYMQSLCFIDKIPADTRWRFGFNQTGFPLLCITTCIDQLLWYSSYYLLAPHFIKPIHSKLRTYCSNLLIYPLYAIIRRQMMTDESIYDAMSSLYTNYGICSFFDGALYEVFRSVIYDSAGKVFDYLMKKYVYWKYDVYGIKNTLNLCKEYAQIAERDKILCHGYVRQFIEEKHFLIPQQITDLIATRFYHQKDFDILDEKLNKFVIALGQMNVNEIEQVQFVKDSSTQHMIKQLFENDKFQKLWKRKIHQIHQQTKLKN